MENLSAKLTQSETHICMYVSPFLLVFYKYAQWEL